ncbi:hypothetical protein [Aureimonas leprariae]|nr:hypothetical protein [Aureimonas leprariae]
MKSLALSAALAVAFALPAAKADSIDDVRLIDLWSSQKQVCKEGDEKSPDTWMACGRSDAFAAILAARGMCLDSGQDVWRVGNHATMVGGDARWRCSLVTS